jgi:(S)-sulfolactate dehydrogenase
MARIVISEFMDESVIAEAFAGRDALYDPGLVDRPEDLHAALADAEALVVRNRTQVRGALLDCAPRLKVVGRLGVGLDNIDLEACAARGIAVHPATGANDVSVAEYVIAMAMTLLRGVSLRTAELVAGAWPRQSMMGRETCGRTLGLIGFGAIARETAARARTLGMTVVAFDPHVGAEDAAWAAHGVTQVAFNALLGSAEVVSLHVPLTPATRRMIDSGAVAKMKPGAILINAARGGVVDEDALAEALRDGRLGGAALDVFEVEPLTAEAGARFAGLTNLILTPHIAGVTEESNLRVSELTARHVLKYLS